MKKLDILIQGLKKIEAKLDWPEVRAVILALNNLNGLGAKATTGQGIGLIHEDSLSRATVEFVNGLQVTLEGKGKASASVLNGYLTIMRPNGGFFEYDMNSNKVTKVDNLNGAGSWDDYCPVVNQEEDPDLQLLKLEALSKNQPKDLAMRRLLWLNDKGERPHFGRETQEITKWLESLKACYRKANKMETARDALVVWREGIKDFPYDTAFRMWQRARVRK